MAKRKPSRYASDAALETQVRYGAQETTLAGLLTQALEERNLTVKSSEGAAKAATATVKGTREPIRKAYNEAGLTRQEANTDVDNALSGLGAVADIYRGAIARERGQAKTRIGESQASALGEVERRVGQIALGAQASRTAADSRFGQSRREIGQALANLQGEKGAFAALTISKAKENQRDRNVTIRGQDVTAENNAIDNARQSRKDEADITGIDPLTGKPTAAERERRKKAGKPPVSREKRIENKANFDRANTIAKRLRKASPSKATEEVITDFLVTEKGIDRVIAKAATRTAIGGGVGPNEFRKVYRTYGIRVPKNKGRPKPQGVGGYVGVSGNA